MGHLAQQGHPMFGQKKIIPAIPAMPISSIYLLGPLPTLFGLTASMLCVSIKFLLFKFLGENPIRPPFALSGAIIPSTDPKGV